MKVKFKRYDINFHGNKYCVLIPDQVEQLWVVNDGYKNWCLQIEGNVESLQALLYASVTLVFNPKDKIIYFPIRNNGELEYEKEDDSVISDGSHINRYDMVFTTHHVQLSRSKWRDIRKTMAFRKPTTYVLDYEEKRTVHYFEESVKKWKRSNAHYREEGSLEVQQEDTLFMVFNRMQFRQMFLGLNEFLRKDLEAEFEDTFNGKYTRVYEAVQFNEVYRPYRTKKHCGGIEVVYYDKKFEARVAETESKRNSVEKMD